MSNTDPLPPSKQGAHTIYGRQPADRTSRRTRWIWIGLGVLVFVLGLWWISTVTTPAPTSGFGGGRGGASGRGGRTGRGGSGGLPTSVSAAKAVQGDLPIYLNEIGTATPPATVTVVAQISGQLQKVWFHEGQLVKKGDRLAQIDPRPYEALLHQAEGTLAKDQAALAEARVDLTRYKTLLAQDSINSQQVDTQTALVIQDEGQVKTDQAAVETQKLNLVYCAITAPVGGRVGLRQIDEGNYVTAGTTNGLVVITVLNPMDVLFTVPEDNLDEVAARLRSGAVLPAVALDRAQTTQLASGALLTLDNQVDTTTGTVRAKARFDNANGALFPNQFLNVRLTVDTLKNTIIVPTSAILKGPNGMFVYVVDKQSFASTANVTPVKVGPAAGENTAILSGLEAGDVVVTDGSDRLKDGSRVLLPGDCIPASSRGGRSGASPGAPGGPAKSSGGFFGLFAAKPAQDPLAAMRCKPGQRPSTEFGSSGGLTFGAKPASAPSTPAGAAPAPAVTSTTTSRRTETTTVQGETGPAATAVPGPGPGPAGGFAQGAPPQGGGERRSGGRSGTQEILSSLNLDPAQQEKAKAIFDAARQQAEAGGDPRAFRTAFEAAFDKLNGILRPDQRAILAQKRAEMAARRAQREAAAGGQSDQ